MVTYISTKNADKYRVLFDKATNALKAHPEMLLGVEDVNSFTIDTLNAYFAYLETLVKLSDNDDENRFFVRLPLDEDVFTIDANSRTITVPSTSFGRYGVGVQGDEMAEVLYFTIDRFFDSMDLANDNMNIAIQWEARDANRQPVAGISKNFGKDIESIPGKIIFGWPVSSELTQSAGTVRFAVRFYQLGDPDEYNERHLVYSLSTLPAEVLINSTINYDIVNKVVQEIDHGKVITSRIKNVGIYDPSVPVPSNPIITSALHVVSPAGVPASARIVDLPYDTENESFGTVSLGISAKPSDIGAIGYNWKKYVYDQETGNYSNSGDDYTNAVTTFEIADPEEGIVEAQEYYTKAVVNGNDVYSLIDRSVHELSVVEIDDDDDESTEDVKVFKLDNSYPTIYKKMSIATVSTVGEYGVDIQARAGANTTVLNMPKANRIKIPGPMKPIISLPEENEHISITEADGIVHALVNDNGEVLLTTSAVKAEEGQDAAEVGDNPQVALAYTWKKRASNEDVVIDPSEDTEHYEYVNNDKTQLLVKGLATTNLDETYYVEVTATRNNISTVETSGDYRVTNKPQAPSITFRGENVTGITSYAIPRRIRDVYNVLTFSAEAEGGSDNLTYLWVKVNDDNEADYEDNLLKLQVDLDGALADILGRPTAFTGNPDTIMSTEVAVLENGTVVFTGEHGNNSYQLDETSTGTYYCIVINELNNNKAASLSPFFTITA